MFNKQSINDEKYNFLKAFLSDGFNIPKQEKPQVIFGYNGIGKTSIYNFIKESDQSNNILFLDYTQELDNFDVKSNKIIISAQIKNIEELRSKIEKVKIDFKTALKTNFDISSAPKAKPFGDKIVSAQKNEPVKMSITEEKLEEANKRLGTIKLVDYIKNVAEIKEIKNIDEQVASYSKQKLKEGLLAFDSFVDKEMNQCPLCDSPGIEIKQKITDKLKKLEEKYDNVINSFEKMNVKVTKTEVENLVEISNILSEDEFGDYILCSGSKEELKNINERTAELEMLEKKLETLEKEKEDSYKSLFEIKEQIVKDMKVRYNIDENNISFDNNKKEVVIKLDRKVFEYSTGEINLLKFLFKIYEFLGSNKEYLILDDPVSSLDTINHYKIVYEIVSCANKKNKRVIAFTHSVEMINAINSQNDYLFDFYYIENTDGIRTLQIIPVADNGNIITLSRLKDFDSENIIKALIKKEASDEDDEIQKLFHFNEVIDNKEFSLSNLKLIEKIDNYTTLEDKGFMKNSYEKIIYIACIRVWLEEKLYKLVEQCEDGKYIDDFKNKKTLANKINYIFPRNLSESKIKDLPPKLNRTSLMIRKVLLNQGVHYQSQILPFYYAMNISLNDLNKEILEIKGLFTV